MRFPSITLAILATSFIGLQSSHIHVHVFDDPIDALSIGIEEDVIDLWVSGLTNKGWTEWEPLVLEKEFDPLLRESNLVMFPEEISEVRVRGNTKHYTIHPIRVSRDPIRYMVAARGSVGKPRILSRRQWGADESFGYTGRTTARSDVPNNTSTNGGATSKRIEDCAAAQRNNPEEFRTVRTIAKDRSGKKYRWPRRYSPKIRQLVVHHSAQKVTGDSRSQLERMRALYAFHANNRGWGDIGYHYVIDEEGQIYEGRAGGDNVVGGHVYCGNVGTIGVMMMGNFEIEKPTHAQTNSLQWLLAELANKYDLDLSSRAIFHGKQMPVIVGHGDLISTECPGYYVRQTLGTIRRNVIAGNYSSKISYPRDISRKPSIRARSAPTTLHAIGGTEFTGRPGGLLHLSLQYTSGNGIQRRGRIATVERSHSTIGIWQDTGAGYKRVRKELVAPETIRSGEKETIRLRLQLPRQSGLYTVDIGSVTYVLKAEGRRAPSPKTSPTRQSFTPDTTQVQQTPGYRRARVTKDATARLPIERQVESDKRAVSNKSEGDIRIRLSYSGDSATVALLRSTVTLQKRRNECVLSQGDQEIDSGVVRVDAGEGYLTIASWERPRNRFRGILECRVMYGELVLINELPLEDYMAGLAEEPDSELYEKQRAFAVAARSYAAHYMEEENRKFPGMPYDGSDTGKSFQEYGGYIFERNNPRWVRAVKDTEGLVLKQLNRIVKAAYFSSDDGRTRSPEENGWKNFPFASVFRSKPDPWCKGMALRGHGVGMSGCGANGQAEEGASAEEILRYYYPGTSLETRN